MLIVAASEVGPALFFSFLPIFTLEAQERRLFHPLAKTCAMAAALLSVTLVPVLMVIFGRGRIVRARARRSCSGSPFR